MKRLLASLFLIGMAAAAFASGNTSEYGPILQAMASTQDGPKEIAVVVDRSGSMGESLQTARDLVATLIRKVVHPGDRFSLINFDSHPETVIDREEVTESNKEDLVSRLPLTWSTKRGTNIRWAHHEALKLLEKAQDSGRKFLILITDGYNDAPEESDPDYPIYRQYCDDRNPQVIPDTPEARDYRRLLGLMAQAKNFHTMGIGVEIRQGEPQLIPVAGKSEASGLERVKPALDEANVQIEEVTAPQKVAAPQEKRFQTGPMIVLVAVLLASFLLALAAKALMTPTWVRLAQVAPQDKANVRFFPLKPGGSIDIGGSSGEEARYSFPLPGAQAVAASLKRSLKGFSLVPESGIQVHINGAPVSGPTPIRFEDSIRVVVPTSQGERSFTLSFQQTTREAMFETESSRGFDFTKGL